MDYYAFGGTKSGYVNGSTIDKYKFTGKERDAETGLDYFGKRYYDSRLGRWGSVDPMDDMYPGLSPYNYCANNPINLFDPDGCGYLDPNYGYVYLDKPAVIYGERPKYIWSSIGILAGSIGNDAAKIGSRGLTIAGNVATIFWMATTLSGDSKEPSAEAK